MEIRHLKLVKAISEEGSLTRAAETLHLSQSALSHQLRDLEDELRIPVFNRINKKLVLTQAGRILLQSSKKILEELNHTRREIDQMINGEIGTIRLSTECYTSYHWLPPLIKEFKERYPDVEVEIKRDSEVATVNNLLEGELDIALVNDPPDDPNISCIKFLDDELVTIFSSRHPFHEKDVILPRDFKNQTLITHSKDFEFSTLNRKIFKRYNIAPANIIYVQLTGAALEMVKADLGITVMPRWMAGRNLAEQGLKALPLTRKGLVRKWIAVTLKNQLTAPHIDHFIELLQTKPQELAK